MGRLALACLGACSAAARRPTVSATIPSAALVCGSAARAISFNSRRRRAGNLASNTRAVTGDRARVFRRDRAGAVKNRRVLAGAKRRASGLNERTRATIRRMAGGDRRALKSFYAQEAPIASAGKAGAVYSRAVAIRRGKTSGFRASIVQEAHRIRRSPFSAVSSALDLSARSIRGASVSGAMADAETNRAIRKISAITAGTANSAAICSATMPHNAIRNPTRVRVSLARAAGAIRRARPSAFRGALSIRANLPQAYRFARARLRRAAHLNGAASAKTSVRHLSTVRRGL